LQWAEERQEAELGLRLTGFTRLWHVRGQMSEAERWLERMLELDLWAREQGKQVAPLTLRIEKLYGLGRTLVRHGRVERRAEAFAKEALQLAQSIGDQNGISNAYATLGMIAQASGKLDEAEAAFTESYTHARLIEQSGLMSRALSGLADVARMQGDAARATALLEEALANAQAIGITWDIPIITTMLGHLARQQQNYPLAKVLCWLLGTSVLAQGAHSGMHLLGTSLRRVAARLVLALLLRILLFISYSINNIY